MWNVIVKTKHIETVVEDSSYEEDIWKLLGDRKLFTSQMGYDIEETIDGFVAKRNGEIIATYRVLRED
jgi:hypothetical protein